MKEEETWEKTMTEIDSAPACARAEDLVTYLYGEADEVAAQSFLAHTQRCASCRTELAEFGQVRSSIGEWRAQALGSLGSMVTASASPIAAPVRVAAEHKRSALAAIREFFSLSPLWMRAGVAALALIFCALIALTFAHYNEQPQTVTVQRIVEVKPSKEELAKMVDEGIKQREQTATQTPGVAPSPLTDTINDAPKNDRAIPKVKRSLRQELTGQPSLVRNPTPKLKISPQESREIARDLRLTASNDEDDLPRLSDLLGETN